MKTLNELTVGDRFLAENLTHPRKLSLAFEQDDLHPLPHLSVFAITKRNHEQVVATNADNVVLTFTRSAPEYAFGPDKWRATPSGWTLRYLRNGENLPSGTDDQIARYCAPRVSDDTKPTLFHIDSVDGDHIRATLIERDVSTDDIFASYGAEWAGETIGNASFLAESIHLAFDARLIVTKGDLVTAANLRCDVIDPLSPETVVTELTHPVVVGNFPNRASVAAFCAPSSQSTTGHFHPQFPHFDAYVRAKKHGLARAQPSEALVLWWLPDTSKPEKTTCSVLAHQGIDFLTFEDSIEDCFYRQNLAPGLYLAFNGHAWSFVSYEGEYDSGLDVDWRPATAKDIECFGFTPEELDHEIADIMEIDAKPGIATEFMAMAST